MQLSTLGLFNVTILAMPLSSTRICTQNPHPQNCYHHHHHHHHRQQQQHNLCTSPTQPLHITNNNTNTIFAHHRQQHQHNLCTSPTTTPTQSLHITDNNTNTIFAHHQQQSLSSLPSLSVIEEYVVSFTGACSSAAGI
jgi:hypothetical protein